MSRENAQPVVHPLFFDALSGEFRVPGDLQDRHHTLGRLALATFQKGSILDTEMPAQFDGASYALRYTPSWAPTVSSTVACIEDHGKAMLVGLMLGKGSAEMPDNTLLIRELPVAGDPKRRLELSSPDYDLHLDVPLDLAADLDDLRAEVAQAAVDFFQCT